MDEFYNLEKKGTVILSTGRAGSHLMGDIVSQQVSSHTESVNLKEYFFNKVDTVTDFRDLMQKVDHESRYVVLQIQDFTDQIRLLRFETSWLEQYHVIKLYRDDLLLQFFGLEILHKFHSIVPTHTVKGISDSFNNLVGKQLTVTREDVYQFLAHCELVNRFNVNTSVSYEQFVSTIDLSTSKFLKNKYPIGPEELFTNYNEVVSWMYGND